MNSEIETNRLRAVQCILGLKGLSIREKLEDIVEICTTSTVNTVFHLLIAPKINEKAILQKIIAFCLILFVYIFVMNIIKTGTCIAIGLIVAIALVMNNIPYAILIAVGFTIIAIIAMLSKRDYNDNKK